MKKHKNIYQGILKINVDIYTISFKEYPTVSDDGEYDLFVFESTDSNLNRKRFNDIKYATIHIDNGDLLTLFDLNIVSNSISFKDCELITKSIAI